MKQEVDMMIARIRMSTPAIPSSIPTFPSRHRRYTRAKTPSNFLPMKSFKSQYSAPLSNMFTPESENEKYQNIKQSRKNLNMRVSMQRSQSKESARSGNNTLRKYYLEKNMSDISPFRVVGNSPKLRNNSSGGAGTEENNFKTSSSKREVGNSN